MALHPSRMKLVSVVAAIVGIAMPGGKAYSEIGSEARDGKGSQAIKFTPDWKILMTLGRAGVSGDGPDTFGEPNDDGDLFVADGHTSHKGSAGSPSPFFIF